MLGEYEKTLQIEWDVRNLNLLRATIQNELLKSEGLEPANPKFMLFKARLGQLQSFLNKMGVTKQAIRMTSASDDRVVDASLQLLVVLLADGHKEVQQSFHDSVVNDSEEHLFLEIQDRLLVSKLNIKEARLLKAMKEAQKKSDEQLRQSAKSSSKKASLNKGHEDSSPSTLALTPGSEIQMKNLNESSHQLVVVDDDIPDDDDEAEEEYLTFSQVVGLTLPILRILQLLCENHNVTMRDFLRSQSNDFDSVNMIKEVVNYLVVIYVSVDHESIGLITQALDTLNEFSMGNLTNQHLLFECNVIDIVNSLIRPGSDFYKAQGCSDEDIAELLMKCVTLVRTMLDDNDPQTVELAKQVVSILDIEAVFDTLLAYAPNQRHSFDEVSFECASLLARIRDLIDLDPNLTEAEELLFNKTLELYLFTLEEDKISALVSKYEKRGKHRVRENCSALVRKFKSVEILMDGELQRVYFPVPNSHVTNDLKNELILNVCRDSPTEKIRDFVKKSSVLRDRMGWLKKVNRNPISRIILDNHANIYWSLIIITLVINAIMLASWHSNLDNPKDFIPIIDNGWFPVTLYVLGGVHIFLSSLTVADHFLSDPPFSSGQNLADLTKDLTGIFDLEEQDGEDTQPTKKKEKMKKLKKSKPISERIFQTFGSFFQFFRFIDLYFLLFLPLSVLGLVSSGYTFSFHLLHIVVGNDILIRVLQSVTKNGKSLLWVALLAIVIIYIYSLLTFAFYRSAIDTDGGMRCDTLWECFVTSLSFGLRSGLGDALLHQSGSWTYLGVRAIFDLSFFIIVIVIGLNIVFGIIVDTFSELREEKNQVESDMQSFCFICSLPSSDFDRKGHGFDHHIRRDHNMWNYILFAVYLTEKNLFEFTAQEDYVFQQIRDEEINWFPINRALALSQEHSGVEQRLDQISSILELLMNRFKDEELKKLEEMQKHSNLKWKEAAASLE